MKNQVMTVIYPIWLDKIFGVKIGDKVRVLAVEHYRKQTIIKTIRADGKRYLFKKYYWFFQWQLN